MYIVNYMFVYTLIQLLMPTGTPCFHIHFSRGVKVCLGVEVHKGRHLLALAALKRLTNHAMLPVGHGLHFIRADTMKFSSYDPMTHIMAFDVGVPDEVMMDIAITIKSSSTLRYCDFII